MNNLQTKINHFHTTWKLWNEFIYTTRYWIYQQSLNFKLHHVLQLRTTFSWYVVKHANYGSCILLLSQPHIRLLLIQVLRPPLVVWCLLWAMKPVAQNFTVSVNCESLYRGIFELFSILILITQITSAMFRCSYIGTYRIKTYWIEKY